MYGIIAEAIIHLSLLAAGLRWGYVRGMRKKAGEAAVAVEVQEPLDTVFAEDPVVEPLAAQVGNSSATDYEEWRRATWPRLRIPTELVVQACRDKGYSVAKLNERDYLRVTWREGGEEHRVDLYIANGGLEVKYEPRILPGGTHVTWEPEPGWDPPSKYVCRLFARPVVIPAPKRVVRLPVLPRWYGTEPKVMFVDQARGDVSAFNALVVPLIEAAEARTGQEQEEE